jgi:hypothetical protein
MGALIVLPLLLQLLTPLASPGAGVRLAELGCILGFAGSILGVMERPSAPEPVSAVETALSAEARLSSRLQEHEATVLQENRQNGNTQSC